MSAGNLRVALLQMNIRMGDPDANFAEMERWLERAAEGPEKPDIIVVPEMWNTGYAMDRIRELADHEGRRTRELIADFCRKHRIHVLAGSIAERGEDGVRNVSYLFGRDGRVLCRYAKIHLFPLMDESDHLRAGDGIGLAELEGFKAGIMICFDLRFPELARRLAAEGVRVLFVPAQWPHPRMHHWRTLLMARAIENQIWTVGCNRVGESGGTRFFGHSMVVDPWGEIAAEAGDDETILTVRIDLGAAEEARRRLPVWECRRPELYGP
ncbi:MAG: nitrilase [Paenibacillaceae bacterium ZCTH02-B3]|nr:MAG: nitrilase [Paenibacillaceae bacterium ZCTH02-B3]